MKNLFRCNLPFITLVSNTILFLLSKCFTLTLANFCPKCVVRNNPNGDNCYDVGRSIQENQFSIRTPIGWSHWKIKHI